MHHEHGNLSGVARHLLPFAAGGARAAIEVQRRTRVIARVERQAFVDSSLGRTLQLTNMVGHFGRAPGRRIVLCAHWDSRPVCDQDPDPARRQDPLPGANDGASGVSVLLEVAELLHRKPAPVGVDLAFFDGEDQGEAGQSDQFCLGAREYARRLKPGQVTAAFLFDRGLRS